MQQLTLMPEPETAKQRYYRLARMCASRAQRGDRQAGRACLRFIRKALAA